MSGNSTPIWSKVGDLQSSGLIATAATVVYDGSGTVGTDVYLVYTPDATNGSYLERIRVKYVANGATASNACIMKFYTSSVNTGSTTNSNTFFYDEMSIPATTMTTTALNPSYDMPFGFAFPPAVYVLIKVSVTQPASCGFIATAIGGKY